MTNEKLLFEETSRWNNGGVRDSVSVSNWSGKLSFKLYQKLWFGRFYVMVEDSRRAHIYVRRQLVQVPRGLYAALSEQVQAARAGGVIQPDLSFTPLLFPLCILSDASSTIPTIIDQTLHLNWIITARVPRPRPSSMSRYKERLYNLRSLLFGINRRRHPHGSTRTRTDLERVERDSLIQVINK